MSVLKVDLSSYIFFKTYSTFRFAAQQIDTITRFNVFCLL